MARYIDEDNLLEKLHRIIDYCEKDRKVNAVNALFQVGDAIMDCKTADVQEVRHGKWIEDKETGCLMCSKCGHFTDEIIGDFTYADEKIAEILSITKGALIHRSMNPFYCSKCGARMDGKE